MPVSQAACSGECISHSFTVGSSVHAPGLMILVIVLQKVLKLGTWSSELCEFVQCQTLIIRVFINCIRPDLVHVAWLDKLLLLQDIGPAVPD